MSLSKVNDKNKIDEIDKMIEEEIQLGIKKLASEEMEARKNATKEEAKTEVKEEVKEDTKIEQAAITEEENLIQLRKLLFTIKTII